MHFATYTAARLAPLDQRRFAEREVEGSKPRRTNPQGLKLERVGPTFSWLLEKERKTVLEIT